MEKNKILDSIYRFNKTKFSGSSPPEIFVGQKNYPKVFTGILSPLNSTETNTQKFGTPEIWVKENATIDEVMKYRKNMIYSRFQIYVKHPSPTNSLVSALNQVAMSNNSVKAEFILKKPPKFSVIKESSVPFIGNPAPVEKIRIEENPKIPQKIDSLVNETYLKANQGIQELYKSNIEISSIIKVLSAGLLGLKKQRRLVPTKWAITATDDSLSKEMLKKIRLFQEIGEIQLFNADYVGNHYEILLLPDKFSFEVIETRIPTKNITPDIITNIEFSQDYEGFFPRKDYANSVTGAYYSNRLALSEYLLKIKKQASCIFFREVRPEYDSPLGVGILREISRKAFQSKPQNFATLSEAMQSIQSRIFLPISEFSSRSKLLQEYGKQKRLEQWM